MAGHNKWSKVKNKKNNIDIKKNKLFTKLSKDISNSIKNGNANIESNCKFKKAVSNALSNNLSKEAIYRIVNSYKDNSDSVSIISYAGYTKNGLALYINCNSINKNKAASDLRYIFSKHGGSLVNIKDVSYLFEKFCKVKFYSELNIALDLINKLNIDNIIIDLSENILTIVVNINDFKLLKNQIDFTKFKYEITYFMKAINKIKVCNDVFNNVNILISDLKNLDYVFDVFTNIDV